MFLCDDCHNVGQHVAVFYRSFGPCEGCGLVRSCVDCHIKGCTMNADQLKRRKKRLAEDEEEARARRQREDDAADAGQMINPMQLGNIAGFSDPVEQAEVVATPAYEAFGGGQSGGGGGGAEFPAEAPTQQAEASYTQPETPSYTAPDAPATDFGTSTDFGSVGGDPNNG